MALKGFTRNFKPLEILTEEQVEAIHRGTLDVLWETGIRFEHERALKVLENNGCKVDYESNRVHFPPGLVEESLRKCPSAFHVKARDPQNNLVIGGNTLYLASSAGMKTVDLDTWEPRVPTRKENYDGVTILDALPNLHVIWNYTPFFGFEGVPTVMALPESTAAKIRNSTKVLSEGYSNDSEIFTIQMAQAVGIEMFVPCVPAPPLTYYHESIEATFRASEAGFPIRITEGATMGATVPTTIAGALVATMALLIGPIVLLQTINPGGRIYVNDFIYPQNMRTGSPAFGAIGTSLHIVGFNQLWRRYGIPTANTFLPNSKQIDFQSGYEKAIPTLLGALSGGSMILLHGAISSELTWHSLQAILDDDLAGMIGRFLEGVKVDDETLAVDLIEEVGPIPGHFLNKEHTRKWWKSEQFMPKAADRLTYPEWMNTGKKSCPDYAKEMMEEILATHRVSIPLTPSQEEDIERILNEARDYYRKKGMISNEEWAAMKEDLQSPNYPFE